MTVTFYARHRLRDTVAIRRLSTFVQAHQIDDIHSSELDQSTLKKSLKSIKDNTERELKSQSEKLTLPVIEIRGPESVRYLKTAEITSNIESPNEILQAVWQKEGINVDISTRKYRGSIENGINAQLVINKMDTDDVANYNLIVKNESGMARSNTVYLKIKEGKPKCEILGEACRKISFGGSTTLQGKVKSYPKPETSQWFKIRTLKSIKLDIKSQKYQGSKDHPRKPSLLINDIDFSDYGIYTLNVKNNKGTTNSKEIKLDIEGGLPVAHITEVKVAQQFSCLAEICSIPDPLYVKWQKVVNNEVENIKITLPKYKGSSEDLSKPKLVVKDPKPADTAKYHLIVCNPVGLGRSKQIPLHVKTNSVYSSLKVDLDSKDKTKKEVSTLFLDIVCKTLNSFLEGIRDFSNQDKIMDYLSMYETLAQNVEPSTYPEIQEVVDKTDRMIDKWKNETDPSQHGDLLKKYYYIVCKMMSTYNITKGRCSRGSINIELEFPNRESFLKFKKDVKKGDMKGKLTDILLFQPLMQSLDLNLE
ncbi:uncharacterized protein LOC134250376 [Saccostrea cucullata]|uniref:uncharacterized protein LOC134250376 n=1 Tax=Saccostrea cuccullata TaxID=36930 RepID=UPI002ED47336